MKDRTTTILAWFLGSLILLAILAIPAGIWVFQSAMEARAYEHATGVKVSTWDAMWVELRVQNAPGGGK